MYEKARTLAGLGAPRIGGGRSVSVNLRAKFNGASRRGFTGGGRTVRRQRSQWTAAETGQDSVILRQVHPGPDNWHHASALSAWLGATPDGSQASNHDANCRHIVRPRSRRRPMGHTGSGSAVLQHRQHVVGEGPIN